MAGYSCGWSPLYLDEIIINNNTCVVVFLDCETDVKKISWAMYVK